MKFTEACSKVWNIIDNYYESYIYFRLHPEILEGLRRGIADAKAGRFYPVDYKELINKDEMNFLKEKK